MYSECFFSPVLFLYVLCSVDISCVVGVFFLLLFRLNAHYVFTIILGISQFNHISRICNHYDHLYTKYKWKANLHFYVRTSTFRQLLCVYVYCMYVLACSQFIGNISTSLLHFWLPLPRSNHKPFNSVPVWRVWTLQYPQTTHASIIIIEIKILIFLFLVVQYSKRMNIGQ